MARGKAVSIGVLGIVCLAGALAQAQQVRTWGGGSGRWDASGSWDTGVPEAGDTAIINSGTAMLTGDTAGLALFEMNGGTLTFTNWDTRLIATEVKIHGGTVNHASCDTNAVISNTNRVFMVCSNFFLGSAGKINVDYLGYRGGANSSSRGQGPGGALNGGGAGHGGRGAAASGNANGAGGPEYDVVEDPTEPGSGGGGTAAYGATAGHPGGGAVRIEATGTVIVNGTITASALRDSTTISGKGSGGSIAIRCLRFTATNGIIRADGGNHSGTYWINGTSGGGGRVAIVYDPTAQAALNLIQPPRFYLSADGGKWNAHGGLARPWHNGRSGSIYLPDTSFYPGTNILNGGRIAIPGFVSWSPASLTVSNGLVEFPAGFDLDVAGNVTILGNGGGIELSNATFAVGGDLSIRTDTRGFSTIWAGALSESSVAGDTRIDGGHLEFTASTDAPETLSLLGHCTLTNSGRMRVYSAATNSAGRDYGALVEIGKDMSVATGCWVFAHASPLNGGAPLFRMRSLSAQTNGGFTANGLGYPGGSLPLGVTSGYGPGGGGQYGGGGHGGKGGRTSGGATYGSSNAPITAGSGGGTWVNGNGNYGGAGGGAIRIEVSRSLALDGTLTANGLSITDYGAGGAGGSVYVRAPELTGIGVVQANGGNAHLTASGSGSGGGGRIAVKATSDLFSGVLSATNGTCFNASYVGAPGTICREPLPPPVGMVLIQIL